MIARERLYLTADRKRVVHEGDPKAATLYAAPGDEIPEAAVKQFGLVDGGVKRNKAPTSDKGGKADGDKGGAGG